jgi:hypothetical protein
VREFPSLDDFILDDVRRFHSPEAGYGLMWRDGTVDWPHWRISYIRDTGEVCAFEEGPGRWARVRVLGTVEPDDESVPGIGVWYRTLDTILLNYADPDVNGKFSLAWVQARLAAALREGAR